MVVTRESSGRSGKVARDVSWQGDINAAIQMLAVKEKEARYGKLQTVTLKTGWRKYAGVEGGLTGGGQQPCWGPSAHGGADGGAPTSIVRPLPFVSPLIMALPLIISCCGGHFASGPASGAFFHEMWCLCVFHF